MPSDLSPIKRRSSQPGSGEEKKQRSLCEKTRKSLIEKLDNWEDRKVWDDFYQTYWRLIFSVANKAGLTREEAFDVVQETIIAIARQVKKGQYDPRAGSFKSWLMKMTRWRIIDVFRARKRHPSLADRGDEHSEAAELAMLQMTQEKDNLMDQIWDKEWKDNITAAALDRVKLLVSPRQYQIFDCYVIKGWDVKKTAEVLGINATQVYLAKHRVGALLKKEAQAVKAAMP